MKTPLTIMWLKSMPLSELEALRRTIISDLRNDKRTDKLAAQSKLRAIKSIIEDKTNLNLYEKN